MRARITEHLRKHRMAWTKRVLGVAAALFAFAWLTERPAVYVEVDAHVRQLNFRLLRGESDVEDWSQLLDDGVRVASMSWHGVRIAGGATAADSADGDLDLASMEPFEPSVGVRLPLKLRAEWLAPRSVAFGSRESDSHAASLRGHVTRTTDLKVQARDVELPKRWTTDAQQDGWYLVPANAAGLVVAASASDASVRLDVSP